MNKRARGEEAVGPSTGDQPVGPSGSGKGGGGKKANGLITINDLNYALEPDLSVAVNKTHKRHFFQSNEYTNSQRAICILNSGADYIDTRRSYLSFDLDINLDIPAYLTTPGDATEAAEDVEAKRRFRAYVGRHGSAMNMIKDITISTRSGDELVRLNDFSLMQNMLMPNMYCREWFDTNGELINYGGVYETTAERTTFLEVPADPGVANKVKIVNAANDVPRVVIPMYLLSPLFGYGRLMPAMLMSGLRIEIGWALPEEAFMLYNVKCNRAETAGNTFPCAPAELTNASGDGAATAFQNFTIKNPYFNLCSIQLSDSIQRALNEQSAVNGLEIVYADYERTSAPLGALGPNVNLEVRKSCSRALKAFARILLKDKTRKPSREDSFKAEVGFPILEYQWQLGSLYFPQQPLKASSIETNLDMGREAYALMLESFDKYAPGVSSKSFLPYSSQNISSELTVQNIDSSARFTNREPGVIAVPGNNGVNPPGQRIAAEPGSFLYDQHVIGVNLERSSLFNLAGVPVNNSRVLALHAKLRGSTYQLNAKGGKARDEKIEDVNALRKVVSFLKYVKLARVFLNNVEVEQ